MLDEADSLLSGGTEVSTKLILSRVRKKGSAAAHRNPRIQQDHGPQNGVQCVFAAISTYIALKGIVCRLYARTLKAFRSLKVLEDSFLDSAHATIPNYGKYSVDSYLTRKFGEAERVTTDVRCSCRPVSGVFAAHFQPWNRRSAFLT